MKTDNVISPDDKVYFYEDDIIIWEESPLPDRSKVEKLCMELRRIMDLSDQSFLI